MNQNGKKTPAPPKNKESFEFSYFFHYLTLILIMLVGLFVVFITAPDNRYFGQLTIIPVLGLIFYIISLILLIAIFLLKYEPQIIKNTKQLYLLCFLIFSAILFTRFTFPVNPFFTFLPAFAMLITIFLNRQVAIICSIAVIYSCDILFYNNFLATSMITISSLIAVYTVSNIRLRFDLARAGVLLSFINISAIIILSSVILSRENIIILNVLIAGNHPLLGISHELMWGLISGIGSSIMAIGVIPYLENLFGLTTVFKLLELANPEHPLLKELLLKAAGTYHHSILVGNLAEAAAEAINADRLLVRIGAYYHDIGKIKRAHFFIENQLGSDIQYHRFSSRLSSQVIIGHVSDGSLLSQEYKLPQQIQDIILQHHGTGLVTYFYHQAKYEEEPDSVEEGDFRYPGPKPQTRESGIIMLADSTEAAVRSLTKPTLEILEQTVQKIIQSKLNDGQLSECPLTLQDMEKITLTFIKILQGLYHPRIEYPNGDSSNKSKRTKKTIAPKKQIDLSE